jgi:hypothetical protein
MEQERLLVVSALARNRGRRCSERVDYGGKDFKEWLEGWLLLYHLGIFFVDRRNGPEIGHALGSLYSVLRSLPRRRALSWDRWLAGWQATDLQGDADHGVSTNLQGDGQHMRCLSIG